MNWILKVAAFKALSSLPAGELLYHTAQRRLTRSVVPTEEMVHQKVGVGLTYVDFLHRRLGGSAFRGGTLVDIGAGWMPTIPLLFYSAGTEHQVLCDVRRNLAMPAVSETVRIFRRIAEPMMQSRDWLIRMPALPDEQESLDRYLARQQIRYAVPYGPSDLVTEHAPTIITATQVLLHLRGDELSAVFSMVATALAGGRGFFLGTVHLYDLWSDLDRSISRYNKYRYSDFVWNRLINSRLMAYNRLTSQDYRRHFERAGLELLEFSVQGPTPRELDALRRVPVHQTFQHVPESELAGTHLFFVAAARS